MVFSIYYQSLGECKIFIAKEVSGQLYYILETYGFNSYEGDGSPEEYLDSIWDSELAERKQKY